MSKTKSYYLFVLLSLCGYLLIGYGINRTQFEVFIATYAVLFGCYYLFIHWVDDSMATVKWLIGAAILFRAVLLFSFPNLSDDFYRFIWDGNLLAHGLNPFAHTPEFYMQNGLPNFLSADLFKNMNSQAYYSVYPPLNQFIFGLAASLFGTSLLGNVVAMKLMLIAVETGSIILLKKLLNRFNYSPKWLLLYALNPLIILEISGNLHFEGLMVFFLLAAYYLFLNNRLWMASLCFMFAVNVKLIPLIIVPYLVFSLGWKRSTGLIGVLAIGTFAFHIPFLYPTFVNNFTSSLGLYFQKFEFNASIYYLIRWLGFQLKGYNIIHTLGPILAILSTLSILAISLKYRRASLKNAPMIYIVILAVYYLCSTTVHPWYTSSMIAFVPLIGLLFPIAWSALIPLTYITYTTAAYTENLWFVALEYAVVFGMIWYDWCRRAEPISQKLRMVLGEEKLNKGQLS